MQTKIAKCTIAEGDKKRRSSTKPQNIVVDEAHDYRKRRKSNLLTKLLYYSVEKLEVNKTTGNVGNWTSSPADVALAFRDEGAEPALHIALPLIEACWRALSEKLNLLNASL